MAFVEPAF